MSVEQFEQALYIGFGRFIDFKRYCRVDSSALGNMCEMFAETHVAEPEAQFESYVVGDVSSILMSIGNTEPYFTGTVIDPQDRKKTCQGVGGHLGEGATALIFLNDISVDRRNFAHVGVGSGPRIRCVDFVAATPLQVIYDYYQIKCAAWEDKVTPIALPIEAKTRKNGINENTCESFLQDGAFSQIVSYWWACRGQGLSGPVGYGIATVFSYDPNKIISHCLLRPKSGNDRQLLLNLLKWIPDKWVLRRALEDKAAIDEIQSCLEGC